MSKPTQSTASSRPRSLTKGQRHALQERAAQAIANAGQPSADPVEDAGVVDWKNAMVILERAAIEPAQSYEKDWTLTSPEVAPGIAPEDQFIKRLFIFRRGSRLAEDSAASVEDRLRSMQQELARTQREVGKEIELLKKNVEKLSPLQALLDDGSQAEQSPELTWCANHLDQIKQLAPAFLAIDVANNKVAIAAKSQAEFIASLKELGPEAVSRLYRVHTSMFV